MAHALALAASDGGEARTRPNPTVGCVLVRDAAVVGTGKTEPPGGAHAEVVALRGAGVAARGATAYVTLEPCDHIGRTGPCSIALLEAGVARVVYALRDPVPGHGGGVERLQAAGVRVDHLAMAGWAEAVTEHFLARARTDLPWVTLKIAATRDGRTVPDEGQWITGEVARRRVHAQRAEHDAVLVGVGTVLADDPQLDVRHVSAPCGQPRPVVLDSQLRTPPTAKVVARGALIVTVAGSDGARAAALADAGAAVVEVAASAEGRVVPAAALSALRARGIHDVYAEPGETLACALVRAGVVDALIVHRASALASPSDCPPRAQAAGRWTYRSATKLGADHELALAPTLSC
ncbi:MAG: diaminohydroxyphosphoribosylaminopyrimidine deaminase [Nonlabens sp.]|jgi:diaminohydroxyphosphoribosylaminopyrimidine deaminase/5-amino-6-(5-phosphoribosylamino)uracil reductase